LTKVTNASPVAVAAALQVLGGIDPGSGFRSGPAGRRVVVLGDMLELGLRRRPCMPDCWNR